jgi:hypothetical protein
VLDVKLTADVDAATLAADLTAASPEGLVWKGGAALGPEDRGVSKIIDHARYAVGIPRRALAAAGGEARLHEEIARVLASTDVKVVRRFERGLAKSIDGKKFLRGIAPLDPRASVFLEDACVAGDLVPLLVDVALTGEGGVKISEVMEALFGKTDDGEPAVPYHAVRAELGLLRDGAVVSPLDLAALRPAKAAEELSIPQAAPAT